MSFTKETIVPVPELQTAFGNAAHQLLIGNLSQNQTVVQFYLEGNTNDYSLKAVSEGFLIDDYPVVSADDAIQKIKGFKKMYGINEMYHYGFDFKYQVEIEQVLPSEDLPGEKIEDIVNDTIQNIVFGDMELNFNKDWYQRKSGYHMPVVRIPIEAAYYTEVYGKSQNLCKKQAIENFNTASEKVFGKAFQSQCEISEPDKLETDAECIFDIITENIRTDSKTLLITNMDATGYTVLCNINSEANCIRISVYNCSHLTPQQLIQSNNDEASIKNRINGQWVETQEFAIDRSKNKDLPSFLKIPKELNKYLQAYYGKEPLFKDKKQLLAPQNKQKQVRSEYSYE